VEHDIQLIPIGEVHEPFIVLRPVIRDTGHYLDLESNIRENGLFDSICVRPDPRRAGYEVVDGLHRLDICNGLGYEKIPAIIKHGMSDTELMAAQIAANEARIPSTRIEFARHLRRLEEEIPDATLNDLAYMVGRSLTWVKDQLELLWIKPEYLKYVDRGDMPAGNAYLFAKIPRSLQEEHLDKALTWPKRDFQPLVAQIVKKTFEEWRQGKLEKLYIEEFVPHPYLRSLKQVTNEIQSGKNAVILLSKSNAKTSYDGWMACLEWITNMDEASKAKRIRDMQKKRRTHAQERIDADAQELDQSSEHDA
jgi:ParB/RepB/Spo0J family partition protein